MNETQSENFYELLQEECQKALEKGREEGEKIGYAKAKEESAAFLHLLQTISERLLQEKTRLVEQIKPDILELTIAVAERVIRIELSQREKLVKLIDSFLGTGTQAFAGEVVKVYLNPEDLVMIESNLSQINYDKKEIKGLRFASDPLLKRGDFRIETKGTLLNFNICRELDDLRSKILRH